MPQFVALDLRYSLWVNPAAYQTLRRTRESPQCVSIWRANLDIGLERDREGERGRERGLYCLLNLLNIDKCIRCAYLIKKSPSATSVSASAVSLFFRLVSAFLRLCLHASLILFINKFAVLIVVLPWLRHMNEFRERERERASSGSALRGAYEI